jgi:hypothetical protein
MPTSSIPQTWYTCLITLPHLGIIGSRYKQLSTLRLALAAHQAKHAANSAVELATKAA